MISIAAEQFDKTLSDEAIAWFTLLESGEATTADHQRFAQWRGLSVDHTQAFDEINGLWNDLDRLKGELLQPPLPQALVGHTSPVVTPPVGVPPVSVKARWSRRTASICMLLVCVVSAPFLVPGGMAYLASDYRTGIGEQTTITLADGSEVMLDADSTLSVDYSMDARQLTLHRGRGYFMVVPDKQRPFIVVSDKGQILALGTEFEVAKTRQAVTVTVFESEVQVTLDGETNTLGARQQLHYSESTGLSKPTSVDLAQAAAWQRGKLVFSDWPLTRVVDEINRYRTGMIVITDDSLRDFSVSGVFNLYKPDEILQTLTTALPIRQRSLTPLLVLLDRS